VSELRLYLRRDGLREGQECPWTLLDEQGRVAGSGVSLDGLPKARVCRLVLTPELVTLLPTSLPDLPARRLQPLLPAAAEAGLLAEAEQLHVVPAGRAASGQTWLAAIDRAWLERLLAGLAARGVEADAALPESLLLPLHDGEWSVLWNEDGAVARLGAGYGLALDGGEPPAGLRLALTANPAPTRIRVWAGNALRPADVVAWSEALGVPVEAAGPWDWRTAPWPEGIDLLQGPYAPAHGRLDWGRLLRPLAWGLAALATLQLAGTAIDWALLAEEQTALRAEMHDLAQRALPAHASIVDPAWQVARQLEAGRAAAGLDNAGVTALLGRLGKAWPSGDTLKVQSLDYADGVLHLRLAESSPEPLARLQTAAAERGLAVGIEPGEVQALTVRWAGDSASPPR